MAFILGGNSYNKDPLKLPKWQMYRQDLEFIQSGGTFSAITAQDASFWSAGSPLNALITTACVADTARTIVNLSNKKGWLTFGVGSCANNQTVTWVITVDGVATTFTIGGSGPSEYDLHAAGFGLLFGQGTIAKPTRGFSQHFQHGGDVSVTPWYPANNAISYGLTHSGVANNSRFMLDPLWLSRAHPDACVRFENSLTVTVESDVANSTTIEENAGVMYVLDE